MMMSKWFCSRSVFIITSYDHVRGQLGSLKGREAFWPNFAVVGRHFLTHKHTHNDIKWREKESDNNNAPAVKNEGMDLSLKLCFTWLGFMILFP